MRKMQPFRISLVKKEQEIAGETYRGNFCTGICDIYLVEADNSMWRVELVHSFWENGDEEISAKNVSPDSLFVIKNRLRMGITQCSHSDYSEAKQVTMRSAFLKNEGTNRWANLRSVSLGEMSEITAGDAMSYFKKLGALALDYKIDLFNQTGPTANQMVMIFPQDNIKVLIHAFVVTRILPLLAELNS